MLSSTFAPSAARELTNHKGNFEYKSIFSGSVPVWLKGNFYRVGPGIIQVGDSCYGHPFEMLSVVHKYTIGPNADEDNTYRNKIVDSKTKEIASTVAIRGSSIAEATAASTPDPFKTKLQR